MLRNGALADPLPASLPAVDTYKRRMLALAGVDAGQLEGPLSTARASARACGQGLTTINSKATQIVALEIGDFRRASFAMSCVVRVRSCKVNLSRKGKARS
jgi:hypothetical protein